MFSLPPDRLTRTPFDLISVFLALPGLRGFWPMSSRNAGGDVYDLSSQGRTLTSTGVTANIYNDFVAFGGFNGSSSELTRADEVDLSITGALTFGGWFWDDETTAQRALMSKWGATAATRSYLLDVNAGIARLSLSDGTTVTTYSGSAVSESAWHLVLGVFTPSSQANIWVDGVETVNVSTLASLSDNATAFDAGRNRDTGGAFLSGRAAPFFICADDLPDALLQSVFHQTRSFFDV